MHVKCSKVYTCGRCDHKHPTTEIKVINREYFARREELGPMPQMSTAAISRSWPTIPALHKLWAGTLYMISVSNSVQSCLCVSTNLAP